MKDTGNMKETSKNIWKENERNKGNCWKGCWN